jgi:hypothetical protein
MEIYTNRKCFVINYHCVLGLADTFNMWREIRGLFICDDGIKFVHLSDGYKMFFPSFFDEKQMSVDLFKSITVKNEWECGGLNKFCIDLFERNK